MQFALLKKRRFHFAQIELAIGAARRQQLCAAGKELRRAALIRLDVRMLVANDAMKRSTELREGEAIRSRAVENNKDFAVRLENFARQFTNAPSPFVLAIRSRGRRIRLLQRLPRFGADRRGIVARQLVSMRFHAAV